MSGDTTRGGATGNGAIRDEALRDEANQGDAWSGREIAIIGMAGRFPGAADLDALWRLLAEGREAVTFLTDEELAAAGVSEEALADPSYVKAASLLPDADRFDAEFFGFSAREAEILDPQQRLFLEHAWAALEDAGYAPGEVPGLVGIYAGVAWNTYLLSNLTTRPELFDGGGGFQVFITNDKDFMPTRASYKLDLKGPSMIVQTSCSTSLVAVHLACLSLANFECDLALAGGVTVRVPQVAGYPYQEGSLASPDGRCRAFDAGAQGTIFGSGIGLVVLKRLADALEDGDPIRAVVRGSAINNDGSLKVSYTAPSVDGQAEVIAAAQAVAGVAPETLRYVEAHGTGTALGDPIEVAALTKVFREGTAERGFCALGSVKTNFGHLDAAAGVAGLIKTVLALERGQIPPSLHFERPNPAIDFAGSPFYVATRLHPWERSGGAPRRGAVSSFGVGGTNAHLILEEAPPAEPSGRSREHQLLTLSARSPEALERAAAALSAHLEAHPELDEEARFADLAYTLKMGRRVFRHRRTVVARSRVEALAALAGPPVAPAAMEADDADPRARPVVFLFPGQGAQHLGMGRGLYEAEAVFRRELDRAAELLRPRLGLDLREVLFAAGAAAGNAAARLEHTALAQPALFALEHALAKLWESWGARPAAFLGHSVGEYVAAALAGVFSFEDALALVAERGRLAGELPAGAMLAVPLPEAELLALLPAGAAVAAVNEPARTVASGPAEAIAQLEERLAEGGITGRRLHTSHAFHSPMMEPALPAFEQAVRRVRLAPPRVPFLSNLTGTWITPAEAIDPGYWVRHLRAPVRFEAALAELFTDPERVLLEVGPGRTLSTLAGRHPARQGQPVIASLPHPQEDTPATAAVIGALGRLWAAGVAMDWSRFYTGETRRRVAAPTYPFERRRFWIDPRPRGAAAPSPEATGRKLPDPAAWLYEPVFERAGAPVPRPPGERPERVLLVADGAGLTAALAARLEAEGRAVVVVRAGDDLVREGDGVWRLPSADEEAWRRLVEELAGGGFVPQAVVHGAAVTGPRPPLTTAAELGAALHGGLESALALVKALLDRVPEGFELVLLGDGLERVTATEPLALEKAPLLGLATVLPQEHPRVSCRVIDLVLGDGSRERQAARVAAELDAVPGQERVALRGGERWVPAYRRLTPDRTAAVPLAEGLAVLITGPVAGNGYALARFLAREHHARLILLRDAGQSDDEAELTARVAALEDLGAEVLVLAAELADEAAVTRAVARAEARFGPLAGVIHAAGTQGERTFRVLQETGREELRWHLGPKALGTLALERAFAGRHLDFALLVSSLATVVGGLGYGGYVAANRFLDAFARERAAAPGGLPWRSLGWDLWSFEDERDQITDVREELTALAMTPREGEEAFRLALGLPEAPLVLVSTADLVARVEERHRRIEALRGRLQPVGEEAPERHPRPALATPYAAPEGEFEERIAAVWGRVLGFERVGVTDNFFELGGDSFLAVQVVERLNRELALDLPVAELYQGLTVRALAELLTRRQERAREREEHFAERREAMDRRREFLERRRSQRREVGNP
jgi:acyl transferase domain-containing protein